MVTLNEEQIAYIIQDIKDYKDSVSIHNTSGESLTDWNPDHFDMEREEFESTQQTDRTFLSSIENTSIVFTDWVKLYTYYYIAHVEQKRPGISIHETYAMDGHNELAESAIEYIAANLGHRPIYFTDITGDISRHFELAPSRKGNTIVYQVVDLNSNP